jgi:hypothetical protein
MFWKILSVVCAACLVAVTILGGLVLNEARKLVHETRAEAAAISARANSLLLTVDAAAEQAREASAQANLAAAEQRAYWQKTSLETYKTMASLRLTIVRADRSLNDVLVPQLAATLRDTDKTVLAAGNAVTDAQRQLTPAIENLARASSAAADALADPHIAESIAHVDETAAAAAKATEQLAGVAANAKTASDLALARLRDALKPVPFARALLERMLGLAAEGAQIWYAVR